MLIHDYLYDPITRTEDMKFSEFTKYIKIRDKQLEKGTAVSKKVIDASLNVKRRVAVGQSGNCRYRHHGQQECQCFFHCHQVQDYILGQLN